MADKLKHNDGLAARRAALKALVCILDDGVTLDLALEAGFAGEAPGAIMERRDRAFVHQLLATTLRRLGHIDHALKGFVKKPLPKKAARITHILRLGAAQILFLDVSSHAAVDTAVALAAKDLNPNVRRLKGLVNAVLRRLSERRDALVSKANAEPLGNLPLWVRKSWLAHFGERRTISIARAILAEPPLDLTPKDPGTSEALAEALKGQVLPTGSIRSATGGGIQDLPGFTEGNWWVQDAAAALPARLLADISGKHVADLCAAPGGKTLQCAAMGAKVTAVDISGKRLGRLEENLARTKLSAEVVTSNVLNWQPETPFDGILLDAPCSATGTLRRHPDVTRLKTAADIPPLVDLQAKMLDRSFGFLKPGGILIYCVCSLQPEEGRDQIAAFLARTPDAERVRITPRELPGLPEAVTADGDVQTLPSFWPDRGGMDGFFIGRIRKAQA